MKRRQNNERGFFTIWTIGLCLCVFILGGVFIDLWHGFDQRRQLAGMVDAAAVAGGNQIDLLAYANSPSTDKLVVKLDEDEAIKVATAFIDEAAIENKLDMTLFERDVYVNSQGLLVVDVNYTIDLLFTGVFVDQEDLRIEVVGQAEPRVTG